jgi:anthranilate synthase component 1
MRIEKFAHVQHIVSHVSGKLRPGLNCFDAFRSVFPAGTLSGAPKVRAVQLIYEHEKQKRGVYGGAIGYFSFTGGMDTCIAIRTMLFKDRKCYLQAGAGIVHDSNPESEYNETLDKIMSNVVALENAEKLYSAGGL